MALTLHRISQVLVICSWAVITSTVNVDGNWHAIGGHGQPIVDKPQKLFRRQRANLKHTLGRFIILAETWTIRLTGVYLAIPLTLK